MKNYSKETVVGIFVLTGLFCIGYMTVKLGNVGFLVISPIHYSPSST